MAYSSEYINEKAWVVAVVVVVVALVSSLFMARTAVGSIDCSTVTSLVSSCSNYITYGVPDPVLGSPCCNAVVSLNNMADSTDNRRSACGCLMALITTYNPNATVIGRLPGLCGISLGFTIDPNTDCNNIP